MINISIVSQEEKYEKAKLVEPNIIYNRFDIKYSGDFDVLKIDYDNKEQYITFHINKKGVCFLGIYMTPIEQAVFDEVVKFLRKKYKRISRIHVAQGLVKNDQFEDETQWTLNLPETIEEYWAQHSSKTRNSHNRKIRKLKDKYEVEFVYFDKNNITKDLAKRFLELKSYTMGDIKYKTDDSGVNTLLSDFYNITDVYAIKIDGKIEAITLYSNINDTDLYYENVTYNKDFSDYGIGSIAFYYALEQFILRKFKHIYLGGGKYIKYKESAKAVMSKTMKGDIRFVNLYDIKTYLRFLFEIRNIRGCKVITILGIKIKLNSDKNKPRKKFTIKIPILEKFLLYDKLKGYNNKIQTEINGKYRTLLIKRPNSKFSIKGNNNVITFHFKTNTFPKGLDLTVNGSNNVIDIYKARFKDTYIQVYRDGNTLEIKEQKDEYPIVRTYIRLGYGGSMYIGKDCELSNGGVELNVAGDYTKKHKMVIGDGAHIARDTIIRTSDGQTLIDPETMLPTDPPEDVIIGNHVWLMSRCIILKGSHIPNGCAVAANSLVNKKFTEENLLLCGTPAKIMKRNIRWGPPYGKYMENLEEEKQKLQDIYNWGKSK